MAKIDDLAVSTIKISNSAVTIITAAANDADTTVGTGGGYTDLVAGAITCTSDGAILVNMQAIGRYNGFDCAPEFALYRGATLIYEFTGGFIFNNFGYDPKRMLSATCCVDAPGAGTFTYTFKGRAIDNGTYRAAVFSLNRLVLTLFKK